jgi:hypothetical protein
MTTVILPHNDFSYIGLNGLITDVPIRAQAGEANRYSDHALVGELNSAIDWTGVEV